MDEGRLSSWPRLKKKRRILKIQIFKKYPPALLKELNNMSPEEQCSGKPRQIGCHASNRARNGTKRGEQRNGLRLDASGKRPVLGNLCFRHPECHSSSRRTQEKEVNTELAFLKTRRVITFQAGLGIASATLIRLDCFCDPLKTPKEPLAMQAF